MANFSCKGCTERHFGCHGSCEKYIAEKKQYEEKMEPIRKEVRDNGMINSYVIERKYKTKKNWVNQGVIERNRRHAK